MVLRIIRHEPELSLSRLVENKVPEGHTIEYKLILPGRKDDDKKEFLKDVTSFINTTGGDIIYGIKAKDGRPEEIVGLNNINRDEVMLHLSSLLRDNLEPRSLVSLRWLDMPNGHCVLWARCDASPLAPHRVSFGNHRDFWARGEAGKFAMNTDNLREKFRDFNALRQNYSFEAIPMYGLFKGTTVKLESKTFDRCSLNGPANIAMVGCGLSHCSFMDCEIIIVSPTANIINVVGMKNCRLDHCSLNNIVMYFIRQEYERLPESLRKGSQLLNDR